MGGLETPRHPGGGASPQRPALAHSPAPSQRSSPSWWGGFSAGGLWGRRTRGRPGVPEGRVHFRVPAVSPEGHSAPHRSVGAQKRLLNKRTKARKGREVRREGGRGAHRGARNDQSRPPGGSTEGRAAAGTTGNSPALGSRGAGPAGEASEPDTRLAVPGEKKSNTRQERAALCVL